MANGKIGPAEVSPSSTTASSSDEEASSGGAALRIERSIENVNNFKSLQSGLLPQAETAKSSPENGRGGEKAS